MYRFPLWLGGLIGPCPGGAMGISLVLDVIQDTPVSAFCSYADRQDTPAGNVHNYYSITGNECIIE